MPTERDAWLFYELHPENSAAAETLDKDAGSVVNLFEEGMALPDFPKPVADFLQCWVPAIKHHRRYVSEKGGTPRTVEPPEPTTKTVKP